MRAKKNITKGFARIVLVLCFFIATPSCTGSPESLARKDAHEMNRAIKKGDARAMEKAEQQSQKHLSKYKNNQEKYFRYVDMYKSELK